MVIHWLLPLVLIGIFFREGGNQNSTDNKEAIWVCQYNYGTYSTGGGGNEWWRINANNIESVWMSTTVRNDTKKTHFVKWNSDIFMG